MFKHASGEKWFYLNDSTYVQLSLGKTETIRPRQIIDLLATALCEN